MTLHYPLLLINLSGVFLSPAFFLPNKSSSYLPVFLYVYSTVFNWGCFREHVWMVTWERAIYPWLHQRMTLLRWGGANDTPAQSMMKCWWNQACAWAHCGCELRQGFLKLFFFLQFSLTTEHWLLSVNTRMLVSLLLFSCFFSLLWNNLIL